MSEETQNDGTWSGLKKTIIGTLSTAVLGVGTWFTTTFLGVNQEDKEEAKTEQSTPAQPSIIINNTQQQQQAAPAKTVIIKEKEAAPAKPAEPAPKKKEFSEDPKW